MASASQGRDPEWSIPRSMIREVDLSFPLRLVVITINATPIEPARLSVIINNVGELPLAPV